MSNRYKFIKGNFSKSYLFVPKSYHYCGIDCLGRCFWMNRSKSRVIRIYATYSPFRHVYYNVVKVYYF